MFQDKVILFEFLHFIEKLEKTPGPHKRYEALFQELKNEKTMGQAYKRILAVANNDAALLPLKHLFLAWVNLDKNSFDECLKEAQNVINYIENNKSGYDKLVLSTAYLLRFTALIRAAKYIYMPDELTRMSQELMSAVNSDSTNEMAYAARGNLSYWGEKKTNEAIQYNKRAIALNPKYEPAYFALSYAYFYLPDYEQTIKYALASLEKTSNNLYYTFQYILLSLAYAKRGEFDNCCSAATKALDGMKHNSSWLEQDNAPLVKNFHRLGKAVKELEDYHLNLKNPPSEKGAKKTTPAQEQLRLGKCRALKSIQGKLKPALSELLKNPSEENKNAVIEILHSENATLGKSRGYSKIAKNIALAVALIGIGYVAAGLVNLVKTRGKHFAFFTPDSIQKVEAIERHAVDSYKKNKPK